MIGIIGAMPEEVAKLKELMHVIEVTEIARMEFYKGTFHEKEIVVVQSGIGKVNAALCTQILVDRFQVDTVINTGVAGSLDARIDIGDIVISTDVVHHDMDTSEIGDPYGQVPGLDVFAFPVEQRLVDLCKKLNEKVNPDIKTFTGRIVSGDQFVSAPERKNIIIERFQPLCTEMEGAAIAHAAYLNNISCVIIRAISDKADNSAQMDFPSFKDGAIEHTIKLLDALISQI